MYVWADEFGLKRLSPIIQMCTESSGLSDRENRNLCPDGDRVKLHLQCRKSIPEADIPLSGKSFIRWIKQEPENMEEVESDFPLSRQLWKAITRSTVSVIMTMVWNSGSPLTEKA